MTNFHTCPTCHGACPRANCNGVVVVKTEGEPGAPRTYCCPGCRRPGDRAQLPEPFTCPRCEGKCPRCDGVVRQQAGGGAHRRYCCPFCRTRVSAGLPPSECPLCYGECKKCDGVVYNPPGRPGPPRKSCCSYCVQVGRYDILGNRKALDVMFSEEGYRKHVLLERGKPE